MTPNNDTPWWDNDRSDDAAQPWWDNTSTTSAQPAHEADKKDTPPPFAERRTVVQNVLQWINANLHTTVYMIVGLVLALSILRFGFWRTFLVALFIACGFLLGSLHDGNPRVYNRLRRFYQRWLDDNPFMKQ